MASRPRSVNLKNERKEVERTVGEVQAQQAEAFRPYTPGVYLVSIENVDTDSDRPNWIVTLRILNGPDKGRQMKTRLFPRSDARAKFEALFKTSGDLMWAMLANKPRRDGKGYFTYAAQFYGVSTPQEAQQNEDDEAQA